MFTYHGIITVAYSEIKRGYYNGTKLNDLPFRVSVAVEF